MKEMLSTSGNMADSPGLEQTHISQNTYTDTPRSLSRRRGFKGT
jgi:hypothetical protein